MNQSPFPVESQTIQDVNNLNIGAVDLINQSEMEPMFQHEFMPQGPLQQALVNPQQPQPQMMMQHSMLVPSDEMLQEQMGLTPQIGRAERGGGGGGGGCVYGGGAALEQKRKEVGAS